MELSGENERLAVLCDLCDSWVAGEVTVGAGNRVSDLLNTSTTANEFLSLTDVSVFDNDNRLIAYHRFMSLNKRFIRSVVEDERAPALARVKHLVSLENYERAWEEMEYILLNFSKDAETYYVAGVVKQELSDLDKAVEYFKVARALAVADKFQKMVDGHLEKLEDRQSKEQDSRQESEPE